MKLPVKELRKQAIDFCLDKGSQGNLSEEVAIKFAELVVRACADHVLESSDRYRKEYFANKILELIDGS
jgi:hypothetical protein